jgi:hypothetical protein
MKKHYLYRNTNRVLALLGFAVTLWLSSCKDTSPGAVNFGDSPALVGFQFSGFNATVQQAKVKGTAADTASYELTLSTKSITLSSAVTLTVSPDNTDAAAYVAAQNAAATPAGTIVANTIPTSDYSVANGGSVTIPAGQQYAKVHITIKGNVVDFSTIPYLALKITAANGASIASNLSVAIINVTLQSAYEGRYTATGSFTDNQGAGIDDAGVYPETIELQTASANSVIFYDLSQGDGNFHPINTAAGPSVFGSFDPQFNFDPAGSGKIICATNAYGQLSGPHSRSCLLDPTGVNAGTGTPGTAGYKIQVKYIMYQGDIGVNRTFFNETYTYTGPI